MRCNNQQGNKTTINNKHDLNCIAGSINNKHLENQVLQLDHNQQINQFGNVVFDYLIMNNRIILNSKNSLFSI